MVALRADEIVTARCVDRVGCYSRRSSTEHASLRFRRRQTEHGNKHTLSGALTDSVWLASPVSPLGLPAFDRNDRRSPLYVAEDADERSLCAM